MFEMGAMADFPKLWHSMALPVEWESVAARNWQVGKPISPLPCRSTPEEPFVISTAEFDRMEINQA